MWSAFDTKISNFRGENQLSKIHIEPEKCQKECDDLSVIKYVIIVCLQIILSDISWVLVWYYTCSRNFYQGMWLEKNYFDKQKDISLVHVMTLTPNQHMIMMQQCKISHKSR